MKILVSNEKKVTDALLGVQSPRMERTINYENIKKSVEDIVRKFGIAKRYLNCRIRYVSHSYIFPRSYRFTPYSTCVNFEFVNGKAYIISIARENCDCGYEYRVNSMSDDMRNEIINSLREF